MEKNVHIRLNSKTSTNRVVWCCRLKQPLVIKRHRHDYNDYRYYGKKFVNGRNSNLLKLSNKY